jgi:RNA polymerase sigma-70 factor (ECF subfamily)
LNTDDSILKRGLSKGDKEVFKHLFILYSAGLVRYGTSITHDFEAARELVQDLFLELWEKRSTLNIKGSIKPYLYSSVYHKGLNWLRSTKIRDLYLRHPEEIRNWYTDLPLTDKMDPFLLKIIENQINLLPDQCREVFTRSVILGYTHAEIAKYLGLNIKTVENHLGRAKKILREKLKNIR